MGGNPLISIHSFITSNRYSKLIPLYSPTFTIRFPFVLFFYTVQTSTLFYISIVHRFCYCFCRQTYTRLDTSIKSNSKEHFYFHCMAPQSTLRFSICWHFLIYNRLHAIDSSILKRISIMNGKLLELDKNDLFTKKKQVFQRNFSYDWYNVLVEFSGIYI